MVNSMFMFQYHKGLIKLEINFNEWYEFVKHFLYFVEIASALSEFSYLLLNNIYISAL